RSRSTGRSGSAGRFPAQAQRARSWQLLARVPRIIRTRQGELCPSSGLCKVATSCPGTPPTARLPTGDLMPHRLALSAILVVLLGSVQAAEMASLTLTPAEATLRGAAARQHLVVTGSANGRPTDLTRQAQFRSESPDVARVGADGVLIPSGDGSA